MRPEAPFRRPVAICSCITVLIRFRRSGEKPACSGGAVGKLAPNSNVATKQKTMRIRMRANLSQRHALRKKSPPNLCAAEPAENPLGGFHAAELGFFEDRDGADVGIGEQQSSLPLCQAAAARVEDGA